jgi:FAD:protein FMN transferase
MYKSKKATEKNIILFFALLVLAGCQQKELNHFGGYALGSSYTISYTGKADPCIQKEVDSLLKDISHLFSIFDSTSIVSQINQGHDIDLSDEFVSIINNSLEISQKTNGAFDITVGALVNLWGFGAQIRSDISQNKIDSIKSYTGYDKISLRGNKLLKSDNRIQLNFNAIADGYAADKVSEFLIKKGYPDCLVEIGGEIMSHGDKNGKPWKIGLQFPTKEKDDAIDAEYYFEVNNKATATSGNYRNYFEENGIRYTHIIDPRTGRPERTNLLSVTVIADNCMTADGYATAFMVLGLEKSKSLLNNQSSLAAFFIYDEQGKLKTYQTANFPEQKKLTN